MKIADFSKEIRGLREDAGLTQEELAERAGISTRVLQRVESGRSNSKIGTIKKIVRALELALGISFEEFGVMPASPTAISPDDPGLQLAAELLDRFATAPALVRLTALYLLGDPDDQTYLDEIRAMTGSDQLSEWLLKMPKAHG